MATKLTTYGVTAALPYHSTLRLTLDSAGADANQADLALILKNGQEDEDLSHLKGFGAVLTDTKAIFETLALIGIPVTSPPKTTAVLN